MTAEVPSWLEPFPDHLLDGLPDIAAGPDARYSARESVSLAFLAALQGLPPRERAAALLRDVAGFRPADVAIMLDTTEQWVACALHRARATLAGRLPGAGREPAPPPYSAREQAIVGEFTRVFERGDLAGVLALLTDDVGLSMPPLPVWCQGRVAAGHVLAAVAFRDGRYRLLPTHANRQPAFACYLADPRAPVMHAHGLLVITLSGSLICALTRFPDNALLPRFGFPRTLPSA